MLKKFDFCVYFSQKWLNINKTLIKLIFFLFFWIKDDELLEKSNEIWEKLKDSLK